MIKSFADKWTAAIFTGLCPKGPPSDIANVVRRKLAMVDKAVDLNDLRSPSGNCLEAPERDRKGQHSIRVNDQWRVCFCWATDGAEDSSFAITIREVRHDHSP